MKIKTYAIDGLIEKNCLIQNASGKLKLHVTFVGGEQTAYGVDPAKYTTDNPMIQNIIESSADFKKGKIYIFRENETNTPSGGAVITVEAAAATPVAEDAPAEETEQATETEAATAADSYAHVEVSGLDDAKSYLVDNFGYKPSELRSKVQILKAAAEHNVTFDGLD